MNEKIYCFDVDDTILYSEFDPESEYQYKLLGKNDELIEKINELYNNGNTIIIQTGRHWNHLKMTIEQLESAGVKHHTVTMGKPYADYYIDDKGITPEDFLRLKKGERQVTIDKETKKGLYRIATTAPFPLEEVRRAFDTVGDLNKTQHLLDMAARCNLEVAYLCRFAEGCMK